MEEFVDGPLKDKSKEEEYVPKKLSTYANHISRRPPAWLQDEEFIQQLCSRLAEGMSRAAACRNLGFSPKTLAHAVWIARTQLKDDDQAKRIKARKNGIQLYIDLYQRILKAETDVQRTCLGSVKAAIEGTLKIRKEKKIESSDGSWKEEHSVEDIPPDISTAKWMLERKFKSDFAAASDDLAELRKLAQFLVGVIKSNGIQVPTINPAVQIAGEQDPRIVSESTDNPATKAVE